MPMNLKPVDPAKVIKIVCHEIPMSWDEGEGDYDLKWGDKPKEVLHYDITTLQKELERVMPGRSDVILTKLQNFKKVHLNLATGEIL